MNALVLSCLAWMLNLAPPGETPPAPSLPPAPPEIGRLLASPAGAHRIVAGMTGGIGSPLGFGGIEIGYDLTKQIQVAAGIGMGWGGVQGAVTGRWRWWARNEFFGFVGTGFSAGEVRDDPESHPGGEMFAIRPGWYWNLEMGFGWRLASGVVLAWTAGMGTLLNQQDAQCIENCMQTSWGGSVAYTPEKANFLDATPYGSLFLGYAF